MADKSSAVSSRFYDPAGAKLFASGNGAAAPRRKIDRRVAKTKNALRVALVELLANKELERITVSELTDRANVTRSTFYLHYETIDDFLNEIALEDFAQFFDDFRQRYIDGSSFDYLALFTDLVTFLDATKDYHRIFSDKACSEVVSRALTHYVEVIAQRDGIEIDPYTRVHLVYLIAGSSAMFADWYAGDRSVALTELAAVSQSMAAAATARLRIHASEEVLRRS